MTIFHIFSKRQKKLREKVPDVYEYAKIPKPLRVQIVHIWQDTIGDSHDYDRGSGVKGTYKLIVDTLRREYGVFSLGAGHPYFKHMSELENFLLTVHRRPGYAGAQAEFLKAHEHYRDGNTKEALSECLKAFKSTMIDLRQARLEVRRKGHEQNFD